MSGLRRRKKRKYNGPLNRQYHLVQRSAKPKAPFPSPSFVLAAVVMLVLGYGFYRFAHYMINESDMFQVKNVRVVGNHYLASKDIAAAAAVEFGVKLFRVDPGAISERILKNPYVKGVSISRSLPSTILISVQEREPVAYFIDQKVYMVDDTGKILLKKPAMEVDRLPLISGLSVNQLLRNRQPLLDALLLIQKMEEVDTDLLQFVSEIHIDSKLPPELYLIRGGAVVELGEENLYERIYLLSEFVKDISILNQIDKIKKIDLTFNDRIVVTRKS